MWKTRAQRTAVDADRLEAAAELLMVGASDQNQIGAPRGDTVRREPAGGRSRSTSMSNGRIKTPLARAAPMATVRMKMTPSTNSPTPLYIGAMAGRSRPSRARPSGAQILPSWLKGPVLMRTEAHTTSLLNLHEPPGCRAARNLLLKEKACGPQDRMIRHWFVRATGGISGLLWTADRVVQRDCVQ